MKMRTRAAAVAAATAALLGVAGPAHAGSTTVLNDSTKYIGIVENGVGYTLPGGRTSRGWLGLTDVDTVKPAWNICAKVSVDYGSWQVVHGSFGIPAGATVVHVVTFTC
jgi:hypothetical protein